MIKILTNMCHGGFFGNFLKIPDCEFYHLISKNTPEIQVNGIKNVTLEEAIDLKPDVLIVHWLPLLAKRKRLFPDIPVIFIEHTWPSSSEFARSWNSVKNTVADKIVYITYSNLEIWGQQEGERHIVIPHAIDLVSYKKWEGKEGFVMSVVNALPKRDWCCGFNIWNLVVGGLKDVRLYGRGNDGSFGDQGFRHKIDLIELYKDCGVFFNSSIKSPLPMTVLEAASSSCPIVSTNTCEVGRVFTNGENALLSDPGDILKMRNDIEYVLSHPDEAKKMGERARKLVEENFNIDSFKSRWSSLLEGVVS